jgi:zinc transport system substrate-binding protein
MKLYMKHTFMAAAALALLISGCGTNTNSDSSAASHPSQSVSSEPSVQPSSGKKLKVAATFYPMVEFSKQVSGDHAEVTGLIPTGVEPHDWEPSAKDIIQLKEADVFVYNGIVEEWVEDALKGAANDKRIVVEATHGMELMEGEDEEEHEHADEHEDDHAEDHEEGHDHHHAIDPHVWLSPVLAQKQVKIIEEAFSKADPAHKEDYAKNAEAYITQLKELDQAYKTGLKDVKRKEFVTQHAAFAYLAKEYGLTQVPIAGLSPEQEPSPDKMADIIKFSKEKQVKTIFFETLVDPKVAQTIAKELGAKTDVLNPLEGLTDEDRKNNQDYIAIMKKNLAALQKALNE